MTEPVFFAPPRAFTVAEIATVAGAHLTNAELGSREIHAVATASEGRDGTLIFVEDKKLASQVGGTRAAAVLCRQDLALHIPDHVAALVTDQPQKAFIAAARFLFPAAVRPQPVMGEAGVSSAARIAEGASIEDGATVEAGAIVGAGAVIGADAIVAPGAVIGPQCRIGRGSYVGPGATILFALIGDRVIIHAGARIGQDGFGYVAGSTGPEKVPQLGRVIIQDDVEIGANTTIDRGAIGDTVIGQATKIDNLVQIAHNVRIGRACLIAGQCGISGSVTLEDFVAMGGGVGLSDHITIGRGAQVAAGAGVMHNIPAGEKWAGSPAQPYRDYFRGVKAIRDFGRPKSKGGRQND